MSNINDLVDDIISKDYNAANDKFNDMMSDRINDALNQTKVGIASTMFDEMETETDESAEDVDIDEVGNFSDLESEADTSDED